MIGLFKRWIRTSRSRSEKVRKARLCLETLEERAVPTASGNAWPHPEMVTISFVPDGTNLGGQTSNMFSTFNARFGSATVWQTQILRAAQVWAQQTNINFSVVSDNGAASGSGDYQQGDPNFGDIRIGGFNFGQGNNTLALAVMPPPDNNFSVAGDIVFNTGVSFFINGQSPDLMTVAIHEIGHAIGMDHSSIYQAVMYATYTGVKRTLNADDISVVRSIYGGARAADAYDAAASNGSFSTASNITSTIDTGTLTALVENLDITTTSDQDFYRFTVPAGTTGTMVVKVQSAGLSLLAPTLTVYNGSQSQIGSASGANQFGTTLTVTINNVSEGQTYFVRVMGAEGTAMGTGKYALTLNFGSGNSPVVPLPNTQTPNGDPLTGGGGVAQAAPHDHGKSNGKALGHEKNGKASAPVGDYFEMDKTFLRAAKKQSDDFWVLVGSAA